MNGSSEPRCHWQCTASEAWRASTASWLGAHNRRSGGAAADKSECLVIIIDQGRSHLDNFGNTPQERGETLHPVLRT